MPTTRFMTTVLPYSVDPGADYHLSVFFSHRLDGGGELSDYKPMVNWVKTLEKAKIQIYTDNSGPTGIRVEAQLQNTDEGFWRKAFPADTAVQAYPTPEVAKAEWQSYPAHLMPDYALAVHYASLLCSPVNTPSVLANTLASQVLSALTPVEDAAELISELSGYPAEKKRRLDTQDSARIEAANAALAPEKPAPEPPEYHPPNDAGDGPAQPWRSPIELLHAKEDLDKHISEFLERPPETGIVPEPAEQMLRDLHSAHRYYDRKEEQFDPKPRPDPQAVEPARTKHDPPDFHERAAAACNVSALARKLGLVVDVKVDEDDLPILQNAKTIRCDVVLDVADAADTQRYLSPETLCKTDGQRFFAVPTDDSRWYEGRMRIGKPDRYRVMDLDPDAAALALEQHLRGSIRALAIAVNGDRGSYAPAALRSTGFAVAELERATRLQNQVSDNEENLKAVVEEPGQQQTRTVLNFEGLLRGMRLEVWDDVTDTWHSLHERTVDVAFKEGQTETSIVTGLPDQGHLQNPPLSKALRQQPGDDIYYAHEVLAGWDGQSLSAPRPGNLIIHNEVTNPAGPPDPDRDTERIATEPEAQSGGLCVRSKVKPASLPALRYGRKYAFRIAGVDLAGNSAPMEQTPPVEVNASLLKAAEKHIDNLRAEAAQREREGFLESSRGLDQGIGLPCYRAGGDGVRADVERATASVVEKAQALTMHPQWDVDPELIATLSADTGEPETVTAPRQFLRWDPITAPTFVPRAAYTTGESLQRMVIRTGLSGSPGLCQRHIVPPKGSELEAEQDGRLDDLMRPSGGNHARAYAIALKERGNLFHTSIQDLNNPTGTLAQPGVALLAMPGATGLKTLKDVQSSNSQPAEGQYIVHNVDQMVLPYLPDPMAHGVALAFYEAGADHVFTNPRVLQSVFVSYSGIWPELEPLRLVLHNADRLDAQQDGNVINVGLPPGEQLVVRISTTLDDEHLKKLGLWANHPVNDPSVPDADRTVLEEAARNGWMWWLTPYEDLRLVHATARPAVVPTISRLIARPRNPGVVPAALDGVLDVHGASTDKVELRANWTDRIDDPDADAPTERKTAEVVVDYRVGDTERFSILTLDDANISPAEDVLSRKVSEPIRTAIHNLPDTKARKVTYQLHGSSRYREFFTPDELPQVDDPQSAGNEVEVNIPSSARPAPPVVRDVIPMFKWEQTTEPEHPFAVRRVRRSGVRIWLDRPWFSSGDGEMLAIITTGDPTLFGDPELAGDHPETVSLWARDPILVGPSMNYSYEVPILPAWQQRAVQLNLAPDGHPGRPALHVSRQGPKDRNQRDKVVNAYAYIPEFDPKRKRWFVDVILDSTSAIWPFLRLAVARYQPNSIPGQEFSPIVTTDFVQLPPERIGTLSRPDTDAVRISVSGVTALTSAPGITLPDSDPTLTQLVSMLPKSRTVMATLQARNKSSNSDIDWVQRGDVVACELAGVDENSFNATWSAALPLKPADHLVTPATDDDLRVQVEEYEILSADPQTGSADLTKAQRLVYADHFYL